jgi:hypothetical protein
MSDPLSFDPEDAFYGPLGELAKRHRDQIPLNLLPFYAMLLTAYGSLVGRRAMIPYCRDKHFGNLFTAVVGDTGCGKGTCWNIVRALAEEIDPSCTARIATDVASAPGLIGLVRDASSRVERKRVIEDPGVKDKRMLVVFEEMENLVTSIERKGSTLDKVMNAAWDGKTLENNGRLREKATDPHLSFICQITGDVFRSVVGTMRRGQGCSNGFFNRFITVAAVKERSLPRGGIMPDVTDLTTWLRTSIDSLGPIFGSEPTVVQWHESTHSEWDALCHALDGDHPFLNGLGGLRARMKPNIMRTAMLNALSQGERLIMPPHLKAAASYELQAVDSTRDLYSQHSQHRGTPASTLKDRVLKTAATEALSLNDFHAGLHRKGYTAAELHSAISALVAEGLLAPTTIPSKKGDPLPAWALAKAASTPVRAAAKGEVVTPSFEHARPSSAALSDRAIQPNADAVVPPGQCISSSPASTQTPSFVVTDGGEPPEECTLAENDFAVRDIDGMRVECFAPFVTARDRGFARRIGGNVTEGFKKGEHGYRIRPCRTSPRDEQTRVARRLKSDDDIAVVIGDRPLHVNRAFLSFGSAALAVV